MVQNTVTITDDNSKPIYELAEKEGHVTIRQKRVSFKPPEVALVELEAAVERLREARRS